MPYIDNNFPAFPGPSPWWEKQQKDQIEELERRISALPASSTRTIKLRKSDIQKLAKFLSEIESADDSTEYEFTINADGTIKVTYNKEL